MAENVIYTIGSSNRDVLEFIELLKYYHIQTLIDIRRFPTSKFEHFKKKNLNRILREKGGYENYIRSEEFKGGLEKLENFAKKKICAIMCSERFPWKCHRRFVAQELLSSGWKVIHIIEKDKTWENK
jgi:uncharacterized protein (DUF488 family)